MIGLSVKRPFLFHGLRFNPRGLTEAGCNVVVDINYQIEFVRGWIPHGFENLTIDQCT